MYVLENRRLVSYKGSTQHEGTTQQRKGRRRIYTQEESRAKRKHLRLRLRYVGLTEGLGKTDMKT